MLLPTISIVTPSYNQAKYLEECIESVLSQGYPNLEYVIMDGGSSDGSVEIIKKYEKYLTYWQSQPDGGQYRAITGGFRHTTGEIMAWINSDDKYHPLAFAKVASVFFDNPEVLWLTGRKSFWDAAGNLSKVGQKLGVFTRQKFLAGNFDKPYIQQESTFWHRSLWDTAGGTMAPDARLAGDLELWLRFFRHAPLHTVDTLLGGYRFYGDQSGVMLADQYYKESLQLLAWEQQSLHKSTIFFAPPQTLHIERDQLTNRLGNHSYPNHAKCWSEYAEDLLAYTTDLIDEQRFDQIAFWHNEIGLFSMIKPRAAWLLGKNLSALERGWETLEGRFKSATEHEQAGNYTDAESMYHNAYQKDPHFAPAAAGMLRCLRQNGRLRDTLSLLPPILALHAHDAEVVAVAANILLECGAQEQALGVCQEFISVNPHDSRVLQLLESIQKGEN